MPQLVLRYDLRRAPGSGTRHQELYRIALEQVEWADRMGFFKVMVSEHHGVDDGHIPSPLLFLSACAARTERIRLSQTVLVLPLHDPLRVAEDVAVLDNLSGGRVELAVAAGYVPSELEMFGVEPRGRGALVEEGVEVLKRAWTGEPFEYRGRRVRVTPRPVQEPRPPIYMGGNSRVAARRAARLSDGYQPGTPQCYAWYREECAKLGRAPNQLGSHGPAALFVAEDPERAWESIAPLAVYETNTYARWQKEAGVADTFFGESVDERAIRRDPNYGVMTPDQCVELARSLGPDGVLMFNPLLCGLDPELSWQSLRLFEREVLPHLEPTG